MWHDVKSSNIAALKHDDSTLTVRFLNGTSYTYANVTANAFNDLKNAGSVGRAFHSLIKSKPAEHPFTRVN